MQKTLLVLILFVIEAKLVSAQNSLPQDMGLGILLKAESAFCSGKHLQTLSLLEEYAEKYPATSMALCAKMRIARLYCNIYQQEKAINLLKQALDIKPITRGCNYSPKCNMLENLHLSQEKAEICIVISEIYQSQKDSTNALAYLGIAKTKYFPRLDCGNGILMYHTRLSLAYAHCYLKFGKDERAIEKLLEYIFYGEGHSFAAAKLLRSILRKKFTQQQIEDEVRKAVGNIQKVTTSSKSMFRDYQMTCFGKTIFLGHNSGSHCLSLPSIMELLKD